jgi:hypothetical protein
MTLDEKLMGILMGLNPEGSYKYISPSEAEALITEIKKVFVDENYVKISPRRSEYYPAFIEETK